MQFSCDLVEVVDLVAVLLLSRSLLWLPLLLLLLLLPLRSKTTMMEPEVVESWRRRNYTLGGPSLSLLWLGCVCACEGGRAQRPKIETKVGKEEEGERERGSEREREERERRSMQRQRRQMNFSLESCLLSLSFAYPLSFPWREISDIARCLQHGALLTTIPPPFSWLPPPPPSICLYCWSGSTLIRP